MFFKFFLMIMKFVNCLNFIFFNLDFSKYLKLNHCFLKLKFVFHLVSKLFEVLDYYFKHVNTKIFIDLKRCFIIIIFDF